MVMADQQTVDSINLRAIDGQGLRNTEAIIYLSGSTVEGFANSGSDIDVFAITERRPSGYDSSHSQNGVTIDFVENRRIDIEFWSPATVFGIADKLAIIRPEDATARAFSSGEQLFVHRLRIGMPIQREREFLAIRNRFDFLRLSKYLTQDAIVGLDNALDDLCGMIADCDWECALFRARDVLDFTIDAWNHFAGSTNPTRKWRVKILHKLEPEARNQEVLAGYLKLAFEGGYSLEKTEQCRRHLEDCICFSNQVTRWIQS